MHTFKYIICSKEKKNFFCVIFLRAKKKKIHFWKIIINWNVWEKKIFFCFLFCCKKQKKKSISENIYFIFFAKKNNFLNIISTRTIVIDKIGNSAATLYLLTIFVFLFFFLSLLCILNSTKMKWNEMKIWNKIQKINIFPNE